MSNGAMPSNKTQKREGVEAKNIKFANMRGGGGMEVETNPKKHKGVRNVGRKIPRKGKSRMDKTMSHCLHRRVEMIARVLETEGRKAARP